MRETKLYAVGFGLKTNQNLILMKNVNRYPEHASYLKSSFAFPKMGAGVGWMKKPYLPKSSLFLFLILEEKNLSKYLGLCHQITGSSLVCTAVWMTDKAQ